MDTLILYLLMISGVDPLNSMYVFKLMIYLVDFSITLPFGIMYQTGEKNTPKNEAILHMGMHNGYKP